ncbi:MAG: hypothetical protein ABW021_13095 [Acidimicrobiia bacterium]
MAVRSGRTAAVTVLIHLWAFLRYVFALAGFVCLLLTLTTITGWFTVSAEGEQLEWYWLLAAAFMLGLLVSIGDEPFPSVLQRDNDAARNRTPPEWDGRDWEPTAHPEPGFPAPRRSVDLVSAAMDLIWVLLVAGVWGGLTYLVGLNLILILPVAGLVGIGFALRRARGWRHGGAARNRLRRSPFSGPL